MTVEPYDRGGRIETMTADTPRGGAEFAQFLLARIAEDESGARLMSEPLPDGLRDQGMATLADWLTKRCAQTLAECEAKRRIVAEHAGTVHAYFWDGEYEADWCTRCSGGNPDGYAIDDGDWPEAPCATLRDLAAVYSDHPDFAQEWRSDQ